MGRLLGGIFLLAVIFFFAWAYLPPALRTDLAGIAGEGKEKAIEAAKAKVNSKNPEMRRQKLIDDLKADMGEIKKEIQNASVSVSGGGSAEKSRNNLPLLLSRTEDALNELEAVNSQPSLKEKLEDRLLGAFSSKNEMCPEKK